MIYLISDGDRIKIGKSKNPQKRVSQLQTGCGVKLHLIATYDIPDYYEKRLHKMLRFNRTTNEWFKLDTETITWLQEYLTQELKKINYSKNSNVN